MTPFTGKLDFKTLAVLPEYQRRGVGERLLEYAGCRAYEEGIPIFGDATEKGLPLYLKNGGKLIGRVVLEEQIIEQRGKAEPIKIRRLEMPVLRWDADWLSKERLEKIKNQK
jgi:GNAT superfamily N-acetyltransferase